MFAEAAVAYDREDYKTAIKLFRRLAIKGDMVAQCRLGLMYYDGLGTKQNYAKAFAWVNLSATSGFEDAIEVRDLLTELILRAESVAPTDTIDHTIVMLEPERRSQIDRRKVTDLRYFARGGGQRRGFTDRRVTLEQRSSSPNG